MCKFTGSAGSPSFWGLSPWLADGHLFQKATYLLSFSCIHKHLWHLFLQDTSQTGPKPTLWLSYYFNHLLIGSISKYSLYSQGLKARAPKYEFWGTQFSTKHLYTSESERLLTCCSQAGPWPLIAPVQLIQPERKKGASLYWASTWTLGKTIWGIMISRFLGYHGCTNFRKQTEPTVQGSPLCQGLCSQRALQGHLHRKLVRHIPRPLLSSFLFKGRKQEHCSRRWLRGENSTYDQRSVQINIMLPITTH